MNPSSFKKARTISFLHDGKLHELTYQYKLLVRHTVTDNFRYDAVSNWNAIRGYHGWYYTAASGYAYFTFRGITVWVQHEEKNNQWHITEKTTGCRIGSSFTSPAEALEQFVAFASDDNIHLIIIEKLATFHETELGVRIQPCELLIFLQ